MNLHNIIFLRVILLAIVLFSAAACDTEYEDAPYPFKDITTFSVNAGDTEIHAAIVENQILLYWPYSLSRPATIAPQITVSENAAISPASGTTVPFADGATYTVTAQDGSTTVYTLKLVINQPALSLFEDEARYVAFNAILDIQGSSFILDSAQNQVYLVSENGNETQVTVDIVGDALGSGFGTNIHARIPGEGVTAIDTGWYKVKIKSGVRTITSSQPYVYVRYPYPRFDFITGTLTVRQGETITLSGRDFRQMGDAHILPGENPEIFYDLEFVENTLTSITYRVPADLPVGAYYTVLPGITDTATGVFTYVYDLYASSSHPLVIVTE